MYFYAICGKAKCKHQFERNEEMNSMRNWHARTPQPHDRIVEVHVCTTCFQDCDKERFASGKSKWKGLNKRVGGFVGWSVSVLFAMAASSTNGVIDLLEKLLKILKEEHAFDRSDDQPVVQFRYPAYLQVNNNLIFCASCHAKVSNILT